MGYPRPGNTPLGDAWTDYTSSGQGPANGRITSPNGDVVVFDSAGQPDYTIPHQGSGRDADVDKDSRSPFYGWTNLEKAALAATQGVIAGTDLISTSAVLRPGDTSPTVAQAVVDASQANLLDIAKNNPKVAAAVAATKTGAFGSDVIERNVIAQAFDDARTLDDANMWADSIATADPLGFSAADRAAWIANYVAQAKLGAPPGITLDEAVKRGLMTAAEAAAIASGTSKGASSSGPTSFVYLQDGRFVDASGNPLPASKTDAPTTRTLMPADVSTIHATPPATAVLVEDATGDAGTPNWAILGGLALGIAGLLVLPHFMRKSS